MDGCTDDVLQRCEWGCFSGRCNDVPKPSATLRAVPSLVHQGQASRDLLDFAEHDHLHRIEHQRRQLDRSFVHGRYLASHLLADLHA